MAYSADVSIKSLGSAHVVTITESECASTSEAEIPLGFSKGRVWRQASALSAGTAATVNPVLGNATAPAGNSIVVANVDADDPVGNIISGGMPFDCNGTLFHRSQPNAGADNDVETIYFITKGW